MKKLVFASAMALASICLVSAPILRAQNSDQITIKDPGEFNAYQQATTQTDPAAKAAALEQFLVQYPQSVVQKAVLDQLLDTYYSGLKNPDKTVSTASRVLQLEPNNPKAILYSVLIKKSQGAQKADMQTLDDAAALAQRGLTVPKPAGLSDADWKKLTDTAYPIFHSAIALDDASSKKDFKAAIQEYTAELMLLPPDATKVVGPGLADTLQLAEAYTKPDAKDLVKAIWFYARAWDYAPAAYQGQIEPKLEYYYKKYHGALDGLDAVKAQAQATLFPPATFTIAPAPTPADLAHQAVTSTPDLATLNLDDKEFILANGSTDDADKVWAVMKDKISPVPGIVLDATATVIKMAVSQDAKDAKIPDYIVNMKKPLEDKEIPAVGFEFGLEGKGQAELDGTYDTYRQVPATATIAQTAEIVLRDGVIQQVKKKAPAHKPAAGHRPAAH